VRSRSIRHRHRTGVALVALAAAALLLAGGASAAANDRPAASPTSSAGTPSLCASIANLSRLVVRRSDAFPENRRDFAFPASVTVDRAATVRRVAQALCALPKMPRGALHCPADFGITYQLTFFTKSHSFPTVGIDATGCQKVHGLGPARWVSRSPGFWQILGNAMGLTNPGSSTFAGHSPPRT